MSRDHAMAIGFIWLGVAAATTAFIWVPGIEHQLNFAAVPSVTGMLATVGVVLFGS